MTAPSLASMATELGHVSLAHFRYAKHGQSVKHGQSFSVDELWDYLECAAEAWQQRRLLHKTIAVLSSCEEINRDDYSAEVICGSCGAWGDPGFSFVHHEADCQLAALLGRPRGER
jgi:hypothetical protein